jgi:hypothetical protein
MDIQSLQYWLNVIDNLMTHEKSSFKEMLGQYLQYSPVSIVVLFLYCSSDINISEFGIGIADDWKRTRMRNARTESETIGVHHLQFGTRSISDSTA